MVVFETTNLASMNETDVREAIVRPLLNALGYRHGSQANIRTECALRYDRAFLGRKDEKSDPVLRGRADYICEAIPYGRWVVEVKAPSAELSQEDAHQAHTYAAHPEVGARYYMVTNGRQFVLHQTGAPYVPILNWSLEETGKHFHALENILSPDAMQRAATVSIDLGRSLGPLLGSSARIVGGSIVYDGHETSSALASAAFSKLKGMRSAVRGQAITRLADLIEMRVELEPAFGAFDELNRSLGFIPIIFHSADVVLSTDSEHPSIFTGTLNISIPRGTRLPETPVTPGGVAPVDCQVSYFNKAIGYLINDRIRGIFEMEQEFVCRAQGVPPLGVRAFGQFDLQVA
ncbi:type I restriction enzyme HsdR N-terminal domain-containing protein [Tardiphaga sp.]|jgi:hypothetical protein|uniref:type I restriction enzyme HsdR N-terminal domain-containing protein n=1 Tax=Tardiphaga sp. TaxID=1926292 RepID=UPI0037D9E708